MNYWYMISSLARTKEGELCLVIKKATLLAPCLHKLPDTKLEVTDTETRHKQRYLDLLMNDHLREKFVTR